ERPHGQRGRFDSRLGRAIIADTSGKKSALAFALANCVVSERLMTPLRANRRLSSRRRARSAGGLLACLLGLLLLLGAADPAADSEPQPAVADTPTTATTAPETPPADSQPAEAIVEDAPSDVK